MTNNHLVFPKYAYYKYIDYKEIIMTFGMRLKELRKECGFESQYVAKSLNVAKSTYSEYENDKARPSFETLNSIAEFFNVSVDYLLCRTTQRNFNADTSTIAAHKEKDAWTDEELEEIEQFKKFVMMKRINK